jgi:mRNA interferase MazF
MRPALVVSGRPIGGPGPLFWAVMITSAENRGWPDDVSLLDRYAECGLKIPCVIRCGKVATFETAAAGAIGRLPEDLLAAVRRVLDTILHP